ncbi:MAG TPA: PHP-associated domain-containing protein [Chloroflexota bacterium]|nr:PHP-associated domain-containing protein [Chloroflexota bacterium]
MGYVPAPVHGGATIDRLGKADLHIHSAVGDGLGSVREILDYVEHETDLDVIAITDHDDVRGALEARDLVAGGGRRFEVITGTEITTRQGHLLAYGVERRFPMFRSMGDSIAEVHDAGGWVVVPHPLSWLTLSAGERTLRRLVGGAERRRVPDAIELFNPSVAGRIAHRRAIELNRTALGLAATGGSDAHHLRLIGTARTCFPGRCAADLRDALRAGLTRPEGRFWSRSDHIDRFFEQQWRAMVLGPGQKIARALDRSGSR